METSIADRLDVLKKILEAGAASTQDELREALEKKGFDVNQSTISRSLRKLGAVKALDERGQTVYKLGLTPSVLPPPVQSAVSNLVTEIKHNGSLIVIHTPPGSASLIARQLDQNKPKGVLGTIAGDDTVFVAPENVRSIAKTMQGVSEALGL